MIQLYFNGKPCEIVSRDSTDGTVCIRYAADLVLYLGGSAFGVLFAFMIFIGLCI